MKVSDIYGSKYLAAKDIPKGGIVAEVVGVGTEDFPGEGGRSKTKIVLDLADVDKQLVLNETNATFISDEIGDDTDTWLGASLTLRVAKVQYNGKKVDGISVTKATLPTAEPA